MSAPPRDAVAARMLGTSAAGSSKRQNSAPALPPRMPPGSTQMAARRFSADRDTMATPHELGARKRPLWRVFLANFHAVPLAAIGHMHHVDAGHRFKQRADQVGRGPGAS